MKQELKKVKSIEIEPNRFLYKGLQFDFNHNPVEILSTDTDFYKYIDSKYLDMFLTEPFDFAMNEYLKYKYNRKLNRIESEIRKEMNNKNNHNTIAFLKKKRIEYINKYAGNIK